MRTIYFFNEQLQFKASTSFALMGGITLLFTIFLTGRLSSLFFPYFIEKIYTKFHPIELTGDLPSFRYILIARSGKWKDVLLLFPFLKAFKIIIPGNRFSRFPWFNSLMSSLILINKKYGNHETLIRMFQKAQKIQV